MTKEHKLDATLCFVDSLGKKGEIWEGGEVGGFESYIMAEEEDATKAEAAEVYRCVLGVPCVLCGGVLVLQLERDHCT